MSDPSTDLMSHTFPPSSQEDWRALAEKALKGAPLSGLFAKTADDIEIAPLYADGRPVAPVAPGADDANARPASTSPPTETGRVDAWSAATRALCIPRDGATPWDIRALHGGTDAGDVNAAILDDLAGGASSICLQMAAPGQHGLGGTYAAMDAALAGAHLDMIHTSVLAGDQYVGAALALEALWDARGCKAGGRRGAVNADPIGHLARTGELEDKLFDTLRTLAHFVATNHAGWPDCTLMLADARPYFEAGASEAQELAAMVATLVSYLRLGDEDGIAPYKVLPKIAVALAADADIFLSLAKLRAARRLIARIAETAGAEAFATTVPFWVQTGERMMSSLDPHTNMLRTTAAAAAAVFAGADAVTVLPFDWPTAEDARMPRRIARNTQIMLAEESHLGRVADPAAGSGYIERLTDALCHAAWERFQAFEAVGGIEVSIRDGSFAEEISNVAAQRRQAVEDGDTPLIGASMYAPTDDAAHPPSRYDPPAGHATPGEKVRPLERLRLAAPFEAAHLAAMDANTSASLADPVAPAAKPNGAAA